MHRHIAATQDLDAILSVRTPRALRNDSTVLHNGTLYQVEDSLRAEKIMVKERFNGTLFITYKGRKLEYHRVAQRPSKPLTPRKSYKQRNYKPVSYGNGWSLFRLPGSHQTRINKEAFTGAL